VAYSDPAAMTRDVAAIAASQIEPAAFDLSVGTAIDDETADGGQDRPYRFKLRIATSPAATDAQIAAARASITGEAALITGDAESTMWKTHLAAGWRGDATVRLSWLPSKLPQVVTLVEGMHANTGATATLVGRAMGTGLMRLIGSAKAQAAAVNRLRATADVGNVVVLRGSRELKEAVDVWGAPRDADPVVRSLKQMFDPAGILNAGRGPV
jgi:hypothetical protein